MYFLSCAGHFSECCEMSCHLELVKSVNRQAIRHEKRDIQACINHRIELNRIDYLVIRFDYSLEKLNIKILKNR